MPWKKAEAHFGNGDSSGPHSPSASPKEESTLLTEKSSLKEHLPWKREKRQPEVR